MNRTTRSKISPSISQPARGRRAALAVAVLVVAVVGLIALSARSTRPSSDPRQSRLVTAFQLARSPAANDADADGIPDAHEEQIARRFAPIIVHDPTERAFPTSVDEFLRRTTLWLYDDSCTPDLAIQFGPVRQADLARGFGPTCDSRRPIDSHGVRSRRKQHTFFLADVAPVDRAGTQDADHWPTYVHVYRNEWHGLTLQYWRFYAYNDRFPYHGGDWEGLHVVLDSRDSVRELALIGHVDIAVLGPDVFQWNSAEGGYHPVVGVQRGSHTTTVGIPSGGDRHLSWRSPLVNIGEKTRPLNGQLFLRYSGLWGSPGAFYHSSGYWGPAFNETDLADDGFVVAWCRGMLDYQRELDGTRECYPTNHSR